MRSRGLALAMLGVLTGCGPGQAVLDDELGEAATSAPEPEPDPSESSSESPNPEPEPEPAAGFSLTPAPIKRFEFDWQAIPDADSYRLLEQPHPSEPLVQVAGDLVELSTTLSVPLHLRGQAHYELAACDAEGCTSASSLDVDASLVDAIGYVKASNPDEYDQFGGVLALSSDAGTLAVGVSDEASSATGIDGDQSDDSAPDSGAVYVFVRSGPAWSQQAYVKASMGEAGDRFGCSVALSSDGSTLAVAACAEDSAATGIDGDQSDDSALEAGAVYVFVRSGESWVQQAYVKAATAAAYDRFGTSVALSGEGDTLAVGAPDQGMDDSGFVHVFERVGTSWTPSQVLSGPSSSFGDRVALSSDGSTLAASGIDGRVAVLVRDASNAWVQQDSFETGNYEQFGASLALSSEGNTLVVGAPRDDSAGVGIDPAPTDEQQPNAGAAHVFVRSGGAWSQQAFIKASNTDADDQFGHALSVSGDGNLLVVGARYEGGGGVGLGGDEHDDSLDFAGAAYVFVRDAADHWSQRAYVKAPNSGESDNFGSAVALSSDGLTLIVGADGEASSAAGIGGDRFDDSLPDAGAVYVF